MKFLNHVLDQHVVTIAYLVFVFVGAEQVIAGKLDYSNLLSSEALGIATGGVAIARGIAVARKRGG